MITNTKPGAFAAAMLLALALFSQLPGLEAQVVFETKYRHEADAVLYKALYPSQADIRIFKAEYQNQADPEKGIWHMTRYPSRADWKVFWTPYRSEADCTVYFTTYKSQARRNDCYFHLRRKKSKQENP